MFRLCVMLLAAVAATATGCAESSFDLAADSRPPRWFAIPEGIPRDEITATLSYYIPPVTGDYIVCKLYSTGRFFALQRVVGKRMTNEPIELEFHPAGFPRGYPSYEIIAVDG